MTILLLVIIYIAYISLGIPDSLLGAAWPAIYPEFDLPVSYASYVSLFISFGTIVSSFFSSKIINRLGTAKITVLSTFLTAAALFGFSKSQNMLWLCLCAFPLGLGAGSIDTALNNYVALHYKANHMNFLHCFYGVGVALSPYIMSLSLAHSTWRHGYTITFCMQISIAALMLISLPVWKKVGEAQSEQTKPKTLTPLQILKTKGTKPAFGVFVFSCGIESVCTVWGSTFFVDAKNIGADMGAKLITFYFVGLALGRFVSGLVSSKISPYKLIVIGTCVTLAAIVTVVLSSSVVFAAVGILLIGFGIGPVFPNMTHLTPVMFGKDISQSVIGLQMALSYVSILVMPLLFGRIAQHFGAKYMPFFLLFLFLLLAVSVILLKKYTAPEKQS